MPPPKGGGIEKSRGECLRAAQWGVLVGHEGVGHEGDTFGFSPSDSTD